MNKISSGAPLREKLTDQLGLASRTWQDFFGLVSDVLNYNGSEKIFELENNKSVETIIDGMFFDKRYGSAWFVDYLIQRVTNSNEAVECGTFYVSYLPNSDDFQIVNDPSTSGVTITVDDTGQAFYETTNQTGTKVLSRLIFRFKTLKGKSSLYSKMGGG